MEIQRPLHLRVLQSFSAMRVTMSYLGPHEQLWMQQICKWFYDIGAGRVQTSITMIRTKYFSIFRSHPLNQNLLAYTFGSDLKKLRCRNMDDYTSEDWNSCQVSEIMIF